MPDKKTLTEEDIKRLFITKAITKAGWADDQIKMEYYFTDGRVIFEGNAHDRQAGKRADYVLFGKNNYPIAVIEAKDNKKPIGGGMQQAKEYAKILDIKFAYSSNGDAFLEHDFLTGREKEIPLGHFPSPEELNERLLASDPLTDAQKGIINTPYYFDAYSSLIPQHYNLTLFISS